MPLPLASMMVAAALSQSAAQAPTFLPSVVDGSNTRDREIDALVSRFPEYQVSPEPLSGTLRIAGSSTMARTLSVLGTAFESLYPDTDVTVSQGGSSRGIEALRSGECDLAAVSRDLSTEEIADLERATGKRALVVPVGVDAVCVFVNADNPLPSITREQLNGIFALTHSLTDRMVMRWDDLDPASPLGDAWVSMHVLGPTHGTMREFVRRIMPGERIQTSMCRQEPTSSSVVNACCAYPNAIGVASFVDAQPRARMLPIRMSKDAGPVAPTFWTIHRGEYPMCTPLNLVALLPEGKELPSLPLEWMRFLWSQSAADQVSDMGGALPDPAKVPAALGIAAKAQPAASAAPTAPAPAAPVPAAPAPAVPSR